MKLTAKVVFIFVVLVIAGVILDRMERKPDYEIDLSPDVPSIQMCYKWQSEGGMDKSMLSLDLRGGKVIGEFYWLPFEKDSKTGIFKGTVSPLIPEIMGRRIEAVWAAKAEGAEFNEDIKIEFGDGSAVVEGYPQMWQTDCGNDQNAID